MNDSKTTFKPWLIRDFRPFLPFRRGKWMVPTTLGRTSTVTGVNQKKSGLHDTRPFRKDDNERKFCFWTWVPYRKFRSPAICFRYPLSLQWPTSRWNYPNLWYKGEGGWRVPTPTIMSLARLSRQGQQSDNSFEDRKDRVSVRVPGDFVPSGKFDGPKGSWGDRDVPVSLFTPSLPTWTNKISHRGPSDPLVRPTLDQIKTEDHKNPVRTVKLPWVNQKPVKYFDLGARRRCEKRTRCGWMTFGRFWCDEPFVGENLPP